MSFFQETFEPLRYFLSLFPLLIDGVWMTIQLLVISAIFGNLLAVPVAVARVSRNPLLWVPSYVYILLMRGTPLLAQMYLIYYGLGSLFPGIPGIRESFLWPYLREGFFYVALALSLNTAGYSGEILRGAILAVPHGEIEAAKAYGMSRWMMLRRVILPRAIRISLPTFSGETILLLKATALASTVAVADVLGMAQRIRANDLRTYEPLLAAAVVYIALTYIVTRCFYFAERRLNKDRLPPKASAPPAPKAARAA
jgi:His/Glu/Gln/Arg/opine family amino acid ABC transporter permease subunit